MNADVTSAPNILVVDDEKDTCSNLQDILTDLGYRVDVAHDGPSALALVEQTPYDVAVLDLKMPGMDGLELYRRIKKLRSGTVAIIVTAYAASDTAQAAQAAGAWQILPKPVDFPKLMGLVDEAIEQPLVLVVDDDRDLCDALWDLFREWGYRVSLAHSTEEAESSLRGQEHKVVLIDMQLPEADGSEVFRLVRETAPATRTILVTGFRSEMQQLVERVVSEGADAVCYKPFDVDHLLSTVQDLAKKAVDCGN
jgi:DNA-binding NtrC family response regulator